MNYINSITKAALFFVLIAIQQNHFAAPKNQVYSQLWGKAGENWDTIRIPDFTAAGYKSGKIAIPDFPVGANVTDFGAIGDGVTDNTLAFRKAIAACGKSETVFIPSGVYRLTDTLLITKSNISLTSNTQKPAVLYFEKGIEELHPRFNENSNKKSEWSWAGGMICFYKCSNVGISNLKISFPDSAWAGHDFHERGYNGVGFDQGTHDGWIKNVTITGSDLGIWIAKKANHITAEKFVLDFGPVRAAKKLSGHHGINVYGGFNLVQDFKIKGQFQHDLTVTGKNSKYNVFRNGAGKDLCIDHHNHAPSKNLFTNLDAGAGTNLYHSGGGEKPRGICFSETLWNITAAKDMGYPDEKDNVSIHSSHNVCVGIKTKRSSVLGDANGNWFETINPSDLYPEDLYLAQLNYFKRK